MFLVSAWNRYELSFNHKTAVTGWKFIALRLCKDRLLKDIVLFEKAVFLGLLFFLKYVTNIWLQKMKGKGPVDFFFYRRALTNESLKKLIFGVKIHWRRKVSHKAYV